MNRPVKVKLTPTQASWVQWAIDVMPDYYEDLYLLGEIESRPTEYPEVQGSYLVLPDDSEVVEDLISRLKDQVPDVIEDWANHEYYDYPYAKVEAVVRSHRRSIASLVDKLEAYIR